MAVTRLGSFLIGLEGVALLRAEVERSDDAGFEAARLAEVARIVSAVDEPPFDWHSPVVPMDTGTGYSIWAPTYDEWNPLIEVEEPVVRGLLDQLEPADVLDAATGTGRHAEYLVGRGHRVIGVDNCPAMLERASAKVAGAEFRLGDLIDLPLDDHSVDAVVCALALTHQPALEPVLAEFARVLRPGGQLITSDIHWLSLYFGGLCHLPDADGRMGRLPASRFWPSDYLRASLATGYTPISCSEVPWPDLEGGHGGPLAQHWCPDAARAAYVGLPAVIIWHLAAA